MNLKRLKHTLLRLGAEEKVIGVGAIVVLVASFLPWYQQTNIFDEAVVNSNGLSGDLGIIGFVIFLMSVLAILFLVADHLHIRLPQFGYQKPSIIFFLMGQSAFLTLLTIAIYLKRSLEFTQADLRYGILTAFVGAFFAAFAAFSLIQKSDQKKTQTFFGYQPGESRDDHSDPQNQEDSLHSQMQDPLSENHQRLEKMSDGNFGEEIAEDEEDVMIVEESSDHQSPSNHQTSEQKKSYPEQSSFFNREAGL